MPRANVRLVYSPPSDALKLQLINSLISSLPSLHWFIYADVDELFDYPCPTTAGRELWRHPCLAGSMVDQMAADGGVAALTDKPHDLTRQYPLQCTHRGRVLRGQKFTKVVLLNIGSATLGWLSG